MGENTEIQAQAIDYPPIKEVVQDYDVYFTHAFIPGNHMISLTDHDSWDRRLDILATFSPTISCSTCRKDGLSGLIDSAPFGVFLKGGDVQAAFNRDIRSIPELENRKFSVEPQNLKEAITTRASSTSVYNEIILDNPEIGGIYLNSKAFFNEYHDVNLRKKMIDRFKEKSLEYGLPAYLINGGKVIKIEDFSNLENEKEIDKRTVLANEKSVSPLEIIETKIPELDKSVLDSKRINLLKEHVFNFTRTEKLEPTLSIYSDFVQGRLNYLCNATLFSNRRDLICKTVIYDKDTEEKLIPKGSNIDILIDVSNPLNGTKLRLFRYNNQLFVDGWTYFYQHGHDPQPKYHEPFSFRRKNENFGLVTNFIKSYFGSMLESRINVKSDEDTFLTSVANIYHIYQTESYKNLDKRINYYIAGLIYQAKEFGDLQFVNKVLALNLPINFDKVNEEVQELTDTEGNFDYTHFLSSLLKFGLLE